MYTLVCNVCSPSEEVLWNGSAVHVLSTCFAWYPFKPYLRRRCLRVALGCGGHYFQVTAAKYMYLVSLAASGNRARVVTHGKSVHHNLRYLTRPNGIFGLAFSSSAAYSTETESYAPTLCYRIMRGLDLTADRLRGLEHLMSIHAHCNLGALMR